MKAPETIGVEAARRAAAKSSKRIAIIMLMLATCLLAGCQASTSAPVSSSAGPTSQSESASASQDDRQNPEDSSSADESGGEADGASTAPSDEDGEAPSTTSESESETASAIDYSDAVSQFCYAFYDQWSFDGGVFTLTTSNPNDRALPYVDPRSDIYAELLSGEPGTAGYVGVAYWVQDVTISKLDDYRYLAEISAYGTQNQVTQEVYDRMVANGPNVFSIEVYFNDEGLITWFGNPTEGDAALQEANRTDSTDSNLADGWYLATLIAPGDHLLESSFAEVNEASLEGSALIASGAMRHAADKESLLDKNLSETIGPKSWEFPIGDNVSYRFYGGTRGYEDTTRDVIASYLSEPSGLGLYVEVLDGKAVMIGLSS